MQIGAQLYTVRDFCRDEAGYRDTLKKLSEIGYRVIQISGIGPIPYPALKAGADEFGMTVALTHSSFDRIIHDTDALVRDHDILDCDYIGLGCIVQSYLDDGPDGIRRFCDELSTAADRIASYGKHFCYHNHYMEFTPMEGGFIPMEYLRRNLPASVQFVVDTFWVEYSDRNPAEWIASLPGQADCLHYKDLILRDTEKVMAPVMDGVLDWDAIQAAAVQAGTKWAIVEQDVCEEDPFICLKKSYDHLHNRFNMD